MSELLPVLAGNSTCREWPLMQQIPPDPSYPAGRISCRLRFLTISSVPTLASGDLVFLCTSRSSGLRRTSRSLSAASADVGPEVGIGKYTFRPALVILFCLFDHQSLMMNSRLIVELTNPDRDVGTALRQERRVFDLTASFDNDQFDLARTYPSVRSPHTGTSRVARSATRRPTRGRKLIRTR